MAEDWRSIARRRAASGKARRIDRAALRLALCYYLLPKIWRRGATSGHWPHTATLSRVNDTECSAARESSLVPSLPGKRAVRIVRARTLLWFYCDSILCHLFHPKLTGYNHCKSQVAILCFATNVLFTCILFRQTPFVPVNYAHNLRFTV